MKRFGLAMGLFGVALLILVGRMNRPAETAPNQATQPVPAPVFAGHHHS